MGRRPTHKGTATKKDNGEWVQVGEAVGWANDDESVSGVITIDADNVSPDKEGKIKVNFRVWKL